MGYILVAVCTACNFKKSVRFGGGMLDMGAIVNVPAIEKKTGKMVEVNVADKTIDLLNFKLYSEPYQYDDRSIDDDAYQWGELCIRPKGHPCPECGKPKMRFDQSSLFD